MGSGPNSGKRCQSPCRGSGTFVWGDSACQPHYNSRPPMIELPGALAVSEFRIAKLRPALEKLHPGLGAHGPLKLGARFIHFVDLERELDARERALLDRLLT